MTESMATKSITTEKNNVQAKDCSADADAKDSIPKKSKAGIVSQDHYVANRYIQSVTVNILKNEE
tara:strand:+ start:1138 stop:1332 length:195 start_codon:yes stop_codon:yes gene_type:complete